MSSRPSPGAVPAAPSIPSGSAMLVPQHLVTAANPEHPPAAAHVRGDVDVPARAAQRREIGERRLRSRQDDERRVAGQRLSRPHEDQLDPGSARSGSRSSKLAICGRSGTAILTTIVPARGKERCIDARAMQSSAGSRCASGNHGTTPKQGSPVRSSIAARPPSNRRLSPRNLLTMVPARRARSPADSRAWVPTSCAMTPPRSMSPTSATGTSAASAKPILAMSPGRRLISAGLPAPSTSTRSAPAALRANAASTTGSSDDASARYSRAEAERRTAPQIDDLRRVASLRFEQHRVHVGGWRDPASACLQRLGTADLAAVRCHRGVVRHVLRLERPHLEPAPGERPPQPGDDQRFADIGAGALKSSEAAGAQNSIPFCALTPARNGCLTSVISVTRSASSISSGLALRPVTTTCRSRGLAFSTANTSSSGR